MKRIILGLSLLLILMQNGFAMTGIEWDKKIASASDKIWKQYYKCRKAVEYDSKTSKPEVCKKVLPLIKSSKKSHVLHNQKADILLKIGVIHYRQNDYIKAYEYWYKSAKLGNTSAQHNLDILCKEHSWVCK